MSQITKMAASPVMVRPGQKLIEIEFPQETTHINNLNIDYLTKIDVTKCITDVVDTLKVHDGTMNSENKQISVLVPTKYSRIVDSEGYTIKDVNGFTLLSE